MKFTLLCRTALTVLIETSWNVKGKEAIAEAVQTYRINRNIVECKGHCCREHYTDRYGINRNIVECKVKVLDMIQEAYTY